MPPSHSTPSPIRLAAYWFIVLVPLGWGVLQSLLKSLPLFLGNDSPANPGP